MVAGLIAFGKPFGYPVSDRLGYHGRRTIQPVCIEGRIRGMSERRVANEISAEIDDKVKQYLFWTVMWVSAVTVVGILVIPIIVIIYWVWYAPRYREFHTLELDGVNVKSKRGVVFRSETNVPLERITDVSVHQGPLMRNFGVYKVSVESAGQTQLQGAATIIGVVDPYVFRDAVLENVEMVKQRSGGDGSTAADAPAAAGSSAQTELLTEIRDILAHMDAKS